MSDKPELPRSCWTSKHYAWCRVANQTDEYLDTFIKGMLNNGFIEKQFQIVAKHCGHYEKNDD